MAGPEFSSVISHIQPSGTSPGPAVEQLRVLHGEAVNEGRQEDAADYERMIQHLLTRMRARHTELPMWKRAVFTVFLSTVLVATVHYLV